MKSTDDTLYIHWSKHENDLLFQYTTRSGKHLGCDISETIEEAIKQYATDYDITSVKVKLKKEREEK